MHSRARPAAAKRFYCYLLVRYTTAQTGGARTYIGMSTDPKRRLRQHNGIIRGGAKATAAGRGNWMLAAIVGTFTSKRAALSFEWHWKHKKSTTSGRYITTHGVHQRLKHALALLASGSWEGATLTKTAQFGGAEH